MEEEILQENISENEIIEPEEEQEEQEKEEEEIIPLIYHYKADTKEFLYSQISEKDPAESKLQGKFVPLIPANATLIAPPQTGENEIAVFENGEWAVKSDYRNNFYKVNDDLEVEKITEIGDIEGYYLVSKETGELIKENPANFKVVNGEIAAKTEEEKAQEQSQKLIEQFNSEFFNTSLGYIRRKVTMKDGTTKDFLTDIVPLLQIGVQIITYNAPVNGQMPIQNVGVTVTDEFINECKQQVFNDFYGI